MFLLMTNLMKEFRETGAEIRKMSEEYPSIFLLAFAKLKKICSNIQFIFKKKSENFRFRMKFYSF